MTLILLAASSMQPSQNTILSSLGSLDASGKAALISVVGAVSSGLISGLIALFGYIFTANNTRAINHENSRSTKSLKLAELQHSARLKIAEARVAWIELFRSDVAELYSVMYQRSVVRQESRKSRNGETRLYDEPSDALKRYSDLVAEESRLKARLLMRIDPNSQVEAEIALDKALRGKVSDDSSDARVQRKAIRDLTRQILNAEWKKAKHEIEQHSEA